MPVFAARPDSICAARLPWDATPLWDGLLARGVRLWGLANDDSHTWPGAETAYQFTAYNMVLVGEETASGLLQALREGATYASTGLTFNTLGVRDDSLFVWAPSAERIRFIGWNGRQLHEAQGERAAYAFHGNEGYVRVEASAPAQEFAWPAQAWSQPFHIRGVECGAASPPAPDNGG